MTAPTDMPDYDEEADALGSFRVAMDEIGRRVRAGEPLVATGYFARPAEQPQNRPDANRIWVQMRIAILIARKRPTPANLARVRRFEERLTAALEA